MTMDFGYKIGGSLESTVKAASPPLLYRIWKLSEKSIVIFTNIWYDKNERRAISYAQIQTSE